MSEAGDSGEVLDVAVVGAGLAGLVVARRLTAAGLRVGVFEREAHAGGKAVATTILGAAIDAGPDAFLARVTGAVDLARELGLADQLVPPATGSAWLWSRNRLHKLPAGLVLGVPSDPRALLRSTVISPRGRARAVLDELWPRRQVDTDPSVATAIGRHLGTEVVDRLVDPLLGGINGGDSANLSLASGAPQLVAASRERRLMRALRQQATAKARGQIGVDEEVPVFLAPRGGVHALVTALAEALPAGTVRLNTAVDGIERRGTGRNGLTWRLQVRGSTVVARHLVMAAPAHAGAHLLRVSAPKTAAVLDTIRYSSVAMNVLAYRATDVSLPPGSGMLVPRIEGRLVTAVSWFDQKWPHHKRADHVVVRASVGRDGDTRFVTMSNEALLDAVHREVSQFLKNTGRPVDASVVRWMNSFPQYDVGHAMRVQEATKGAEQEHVYLTGAAYDGVGMPATIRNAELCAQKILTRTGSGHGS
jgi:protoporphyrinogen/coproporphyrinogen III oxidase